MRATRAEASTQLQQYILVVFEVMVAFLIIYVTVTASSLLKSNKGTDTSLSETIADIRAVATGDKSVARVTRFWVADGIYEVAFDAGLQTVRDSCTGETIVRPDRCGIGTCLCKCAEGSRCTGAVECVSFPTVRSIVVVGLSQDGFKGQAKTDASGKDFVVYGKCSWSDKSLVPVPVYVYKSGNDIVIADKAPAAQPAATTA
jgi:hypothetical protein